MIGAALQMIGWAFLPTLALPVVFLFAPKNTFLQSLVAGVIQIIDAGVHALGEVVKWSVPVLVLSVGASVFVLSIFGVTTTKWLESAKYFQAIIIMLGAATTLLAGQHVRVDVLYSQMSEPARARTEMLGFYVLMLPACLLIIWNAQSFVGFSWAMREGSSEADGIKGVFLLKTLIPVFALSMIVQGYAITLRAAMAIAGQTRPDRPKNIPPFFQINSEDTL